MENVVKDATITVRIPQELKAWVQAPGTLGKRSLSETVCCALDMARTQEENATTPEAPRQENGREGGIEIPGEDGEWLRAQARETGVSEAGILTHALHRLREEFEAGRLAWTIPA
ncbi:MAG: hypothetical protein QGF68_14680 [Nitrospinota bacterium]|nr:hypothetical protein [Nitrospinota bacterium]MDP7384617.1 hypothetical protein [Nitrospinota bacterium]